MRTNSIGMSANNNSNRRSVDRDHRQASSIISQIRNLCAELEEILLDDIGNDPDGSLEGCRVQVINGVNKGLIGRVTERRGTHFWNICLEDDGRMIYKTQQNLRKL